jgi:hypothetical protein
MAARIDHLVVAAASLEQGVPGARPRWAWCPGPAANIR